jgi:hypothetical protein
MPRAACALVSPVRALALLALALLPQTRAALMLLTRQTQSAENMHSVTHPQAGQRQLLTFEATQSSLVDVNEQYVATHVQSVPTLSLLDSIAFDNETESWSFSYETMAVDSSVPGQVNRFYRVLYLTRAGHDVGSSDTGNPCLRAGAAYAECLRALRTDYVVLEDPDAAQDESARDRLETSSWLCAECPAGPAAETSVNVTLEPHAFSATQTLRLRIPHAVIRTALARLRNSTRSDSPAYAELGTQPALDFGVGMMFLPHPDANTAASPPNNLLIFDMFTVLENTFEQLAIMKQTSYSIATHVAFWTAAAQSDPRIRVVSIEYLLDLGHLLTDVKVSVNNGSLAAGGSMVPISPADCAAAQALVDALPDARCIAQTPLCTPTRYVEGSGSPLQTPLTTSWGARPPVITLAGSKRVTMLRLKRVTMLRLERTGRLGQDRRTARRTPRDDRVLPQHTSYWRAHPRQAQPRCLRSSIRRQLLHQGQSLRCARGTLGHQSRSQGGRRP